jgi:hypothetical protein
MTTGGPAFWTPIPDDEHQIAPGMFLRDYFAAKVMQGIAASPMFVEWSSSEVARCAYAQADAMIAAREAA